MKVSLRWLAELLQLPTLEPEALGAAFSSLGHEVEAIEQLVRPFSGVVVSKVVEIHPHPNADRLRLVTVDQGNGTQQVVCGAWNFEVGERAPLAVVGAVLDGGLTVSKREIRGVVSEGMLCSAKELGLGDDASGILVLSEDAAPGSDFGDLVPLPDVVFDLAITANRGDCMSMVGIARELAAFFDTELSLPTTQVSSPAPGLSVASSQVDTGEAGAIQIGLEDPVGCPRYIGQEVVEVRVGRSPLWLRSRLTAAGVRPLNNIVDVTNYVMLELGQPVHAFDSDRLGGGRIVVRRAQTGETLQTLDGVSRRLGTTELVIADASRPVALAGVMGGADTEVSTTTRNLLIEAASFEAASVSATARRHGLFSEASARFSRGVDPAGPSLAATRAAALIRTLAGGTVRRPTTVGVAVPPPVRILLPASEVHRLLGVRMETVEIAGLLRRLGLGVEEADPLSVTVPSLRLDLTRPADLVEEVARVRGYDWFPTRVTPGPGTGLDAAQRRERSMRQVLVGLGLSEALTYTFVARNVIDAFRFPGDDLRGNPIAVTNPLREEEGWLRTSLLPGLLAAAAYNRDRGMDRVGLFEIGNVFLRRPHPLDSSLPDQPGRVAFVVVGAAGPLHLGGGRDADAGVAAGVVTSLVSAISDQAIRLEASLQPGFHPGRSALVHLGDRELGVVGELHPNTAAAFGFEFRVAAGELESAPLLEFTGHRPFSSPSRFPHAGFDLAFDVASELVAATVISVVEKTGEGLLETVELFDVFSGPPLGQGRKSLAFHLRARGRQATLADQDVASLRRRIIEAVEQQLGAKLRGE